MLLDMLQACKEKPPTLKDQKALLDKVPHDHEEGTFTLPQRVINGNFKIQSDFNKQFDVDNDTVLSQAFKALANQGPHHS